MIYLFIYFILRYFTNQELVHVGNWQTIFSIIKEKTLKSSKNLEIKNLINYLILLNTNLTFIHLRLNDAASAIENLNKFNFDEKKHWQQIRFYESSNQNFFVLKLNISFSYIFFYHFRPLIKYQTRQTSTRSSL